MVFSNWFLGNWFFLMEIFCDWFLNDWLFLMVVFYDWFSNNWLRYFWFFNNRFSTILPNKNIAQVLPRFFVVRNVSDSCDVENKKQSN